MSDRMEDIRREIAALYKKHKPLARRHVWKWAQKHPNSALYKEFEWDTQKAAEAHWDERAGELIRFVTVLVETGNITYKIPQYIPDPDATTNVSGYVETLERRTAASARRIMLDELARCEGAIDRARNVCGALSAAHPGIDVELQRMLEHLIVIRQALAA